MATFEEQKQQYNPDYSKPVWSPSDNIIRYIKEKEGFRDHWYLDSKGIPTIGYGLSEPYLREHGLLDQFPPIGDKSKLPSGDQHRANKGQETISESFASGFFIDALKDFESQVMSIRGVEGLNDGQRDALLSYFYNAGSNQPKLKKAIEEGRYNDAKLQIDAGFDNEEVPSLRKRRLEERDIWDGKYFNSSETDLNSGEGVTQGVTSVNTGSNGAGSNNIEFDPGNIRDYGLLDVPSRDYGLLDYEGLKNNGLLAYGGNLFDVGGPVDSRVYPEKESDYTSEDWAAKRAFLIKQEQDLTDEQYELYRAKEKDRYDKITQVALPTGYLDGKADLGEYQQLFDSWYANVGALEGFHENAYNDKVSKSRPMVPTIGSGLTYYRDINGREGRAVHIKDTITKEQADEQLRRTALYNIKRLKKKYSRFKDFDPAVQYYLLDKYFQSGSESDDDFLSALKDYNDNHVYDRNFDVQALLHTRKLNYDEDNIGLRKREELRINKALNTDYLAGDNIENIHKKFITNRDAIKQKHNSIVDRANEIFKTDPKYTSFNTLNRDAQRQAWDDIYKIATKQVRGEQWGNNISTIQNALSVNPSLAVAVQQSGLQGSPTVPENTIQPETPKDSLVSRILGLFSLGGNLFAKGDPIVLGMPYKDGIKGTTKN